MQEGSFGVDREQACAMRHKWRDMTLSCALTAYLLMRQCARLVKSAWPFTGTSGRSPGEPSWTDGSPAPCSACTPATCVDGAARCHGAAMIAVGIMCTLTPQQECGCVCKKQRLETNLAGRMAEQLNPSGPLALVQVLSALRFRSSG